MTRLLLWVGVLVGIWSLTNSGAKSAYFVLSVLGYTAVVCAITFKGNRHMSFSMDEDYSSSK